jgi:hypothetical protein
VVQLLNGLVDFDEMLYGDDGIEDGRPSVRSYE